MGQLGEIHRDEGGITTAFCCTIRRPLMAHWWGSAAGGR